MRFVHQMAWNHGRTIRLANGVFAAVFSAESLEQAVKDGATLADFVA